jgi:hypothetical protein
MYIDVNMYESQKWFCPCLTRGPKESGMALQCTANKGLCKFKYCPFVHWARFIIQDQTNVRPNKGGTAAD